MISYSVVSIIALVVLLIINLHTLSTKDTSQEKRAYRHLVIGLIFFFTTETAWGFLDQSSYQKLLQIDTMADYFTMTMAVMLCWRYFVAFLKVKSFVSRNMTGIIITVFAFWIAMLVLNWYTPLFFWYTESGGFRAGTFRDVVLLVQISWFAVMALMSLQASFKATGNIKSRNKTIALFGFIMTATSILQWRFPLLPLNTVGFFLGMLIIHVFIHEEEIKQNMNEIKQLNQERKEREFHYRAELDKLNTMMDASGIGIWQLVEQEGQHPRLIANRKMQELMGISSQNLTPEQIHELLVEGIHPDDQEPFMKYDKVLKSGKHGEVTYRWKHPTLGYRYVRFGGAAMTFGAHYEANGYHADVTEQIKREQELRDSIEANKSKTRFLQNMSHEIRTPLNAMFGFSQLLGMPDGCWTDEEKENYNTYIYNSYNMMDMLISDILDIADSDHGNYQIHESDVRVNHICQFAMMAVEFRRSSAVEMKFTSDVDDDYTFKSDGRRIQQVLVNYLTNACKNTQQGEIILNVSTTERPGRLTLSVTDTGIGVPPEKAEQIFGRFTKLDRHAQGSGLGLNICHTIATKMGGEVYLDTCYTKGARFVFVI
ncbi:MAG: PAS domain-containing sensor histidine kinase [Bacteroidales bacterium]|nr:PAS domain-containing sensor histidine kinase [Bacteroidales bacterium]